jgi:hypothetical protein
MSCRLPTRSVGPTDRSVGLLVGQTHLSGTAVSLVGGDPRVSMSHIIFFLAFLLFFAAFFAASSPSLTSSSLESESESESDEESSELSMLDGVRLGALPVRSPT